MRTRPLNKRYVQDIMNIEIKNIKYLDEFIRLNEEWISTYFELEEVDRDLAANPGRIIENGGYIFSLLVGEKVVGTCALFKESEGVFELARMAVSPEYQGLGYGKLLMNECFSVLKEIKASKVFLVSNTKLESAIAMYKAFDFNTVQEGQHPLYSRANIVMERSCT